MRAPSAVIEVLLVASLAVLPGCQAQIESKGADEVDHAQQSAEAEVEGQSVSLGSMSCVVPNDWSVKLDEKGTTLRLLSNDGVCIITGPVSLGTTDLASYAAAAYKGVSGNIDTMSKIERGNFAGHDCYRFNMELNKAAGETIVVEYDSNVYTIMYEVYSDKDGSAIAAVVDSISFN